MMAGGWTGDGYGAWIRSSDTEAFLIDQPLLYPAGTVHSYNSAAVHLLSVLTSELVSQLFISYADSRLFHPLGIIDREWEMFDSGYPNGGAGIDLHARDLAKIGQLFLQRGMSGDRQIIPGAWVDEATSSKFAFTLNHAGLTNISYGYLWWTDETYGVSSYFAWGYGGQYIYVSPARNLVVVITTSHQNVHQEFGGENETATAALEVISRHILGAVSQE
jgi:CubicO group peptidase (beta-lactamase class C family)